MIESEMAAMRENAQRVGRLLLAGGQPTEDEIQAALLIAWKELAASQAKASPEEHCRYLAAAVAKLLPAR
ncbi:MAG: hypothetical protein LC792_00425 [Actinobacteria bacterium]|nr:hypothetical protein [Actinomycetota bacterium]